MIVMNINSLILLLHMYTLGMDCAFYFYSTCYYFLGPAGSFIKKRKGQKDRLLFRATLDVCDWFIILTR